MPGRIPDLRIASDGNWYYLKTPIGRPALVKLFASVLKREGDRYFLVTPVEKCGITVDDVAALYAEYQSRGVTFAQPLETKPWGMREFVVWDNSGFILHVGQDA